MSYRTSQDGMYQRGHHKQMSSLGGDGSSWGGTQTLSLKDTLILYAKFAQQGLIDASHFTVAIKKATQDKLISARLLKSSLLQLVTLLSSLLIKPLIARATGGASADARSSAHATYSIAWWLFHLIWLWPLAAVATYYSGLLRPTQESDRRRGAAAAVSDPKGLVAGLVAESYRPLILANYFVVVYVLSWIPVLGPIAGFLYACLVDSYYLFENHWLRSNWSLSERIKNVETRWAYHLGFGLPITFFSWWCSDPVANLALFALAYPLCQLLAPQALPQPLDPNSPTSGLAMSNLASFMPKSQGSFSIAAAEGGEETRGRKAHPNVPVRIPVLAGAQIVYETVSGAFKGPGGGRKKDAGGSGAYGAGGGGAYGASAYGGGSGAFGGGGQGAFSNGGDAYGAVPPPAQNYASADQFAGGGFPNQDAYAQPASSSYADASFNQSYPAPPQSSGAFASSAYSAPATSDGYANASSGATAYAGSYAGAQSNGAQAQRRGYAPPPDAGAGVGAGGGAGVVDRKLDSLISEAARRKKGD